MDRKQLHRYCLSLKGATAEYPFGPDPCVYKVGGKMFAIAGEAKPLQVSLKCDPVLARILREHYPAIVPGYHLNKDHWNTVTIDGSIADGHIHEMIDDSYRLVVRGLTRKLRTEIGLKQ